MFVLSDVLKSVNQIFEAGIAITALSLFIRSLSFNLRDRVSRSFAVILACVMVIFTGEAIIGSVKEPEVFEMWLKFQWLGILFLPAALQHFADALLATTGRPSRGRRRLVVYSSYGFSFVLAIALFWGFVLGPIEASESVFPHATPTPISTLFTLYYIGSTLVAGVGIWRAYKRTRLRVSRRRITYLQVGALFLAIGAYPYMMIGSAYASRFANLFIPLVVVGNIGIFLCLLLMAYAVAFFGVPWPDRIVRTRLLKWVLRGPITVFVMLFLITLTNQVLSSYGASNVIAIPIVSVVSVLFAEHLITLVYPFIESWVLNFGNNDQFELLQTLSERLITSGDLRQFLEAILAAVCDLFQVSVGFVVGQNGDGWEIVVHAGDIKELQLDSLNQDVLERVKGSNGQSIFAWGDFWLYPLYSTLGDDIVGLIGVLRKEDHELDDVLTESLGVLGDRATMALVDQRLQRQVFIALEELGPKIDLIQRLRAEFQFDQTDILQTINQESLPDDFSQWVKDALSHYWGGPKLTESPLLELEIVQKEKEQFEGNSANALRSILKDALNQVRPQGEKMYTPEWILYNILEMKFLEGRKVRDIARRLAVSEADLYRKQRVAIESVANAIVEMEMKARES